jgi:EmrB/QacA subfamily drug resistance transporter
VTRHDRLVLLVGCVGVFVVFIDTTIVNIAFHTISHSLGSSTASLAWVLNAYSLVFAATLIPAGGIADRYGRKRVFIAGLCGFTVVSTLCGLAPDTGVLIAARGLQALFAALIVPTSLALILAEYPVERRHVAVGTWGTMGAAAAAIGPTVGALLTEYASWRWIFLVNVPVCAAIAGLGVRLLAETGEHSGTGIPDPWEIGLIASSPALISFAVIEGPTWGWANVRVLAAGALGIALVPVLIRRAGHSSVPVIDLALFRFRQFRLVNAAILLFATAFYGMLLGNVIFLQTGWHYSILRTALASAPSPLVVIAVGRRSSRLAARIGYRPVLLAGACAWGTGSLALACSVSDSPHWLTHWLPWSLLLGLGIGLTFPVQSGAAVQALPASRYALGSAIAFSSRQLGAVLGISIFVALDATAGSGDIVADFHRSWYLFAGLGLASGLVLLLPARRRGQA